MKRAFFGGTFDPIHAAHVTVAREAADAFGLDQVLMIPAGQPPHKGTATAYEHRLDRKSTRLNSSHSQQSRMPSSA